MRIAIIVAFGLVAMCFAGSPLGSVQEETVTIGVAGRSSQTPWVAALKDFVVVAFGAQTPQGKADVFVAVSRDGGRSFAAPVRVNAVEDDTRLGGELPPRVGVAARSGLEPEIVVAYGAKSEQTEVRVARSSDGGRTYSPSRALQAAGAPGDRGWHAMALDGRGVAHVMWLDHRGLASPAGSARAASSGPQTASHDHHMEQAAIDGVAMAMRSGLYYAQDGGASAGERELAKGVCYCCKVAMATTPSGAIYAAWRHVYAGNIRDIAFAASFDGEGRFSPPSRVSVDDWHLAGCPDDGPAMSVDDRGTAHIVWPTVLGGSTPEGALFYASSTDGKSFTPRVRIPTLGSPRPMHPQVISESHDRVVVAWDEVVDGVRRAAVRGVRFDEAGQPIFGAARRLGSPEAPSSYPILVATPRGTLAVYVDGKPGASQIRVTGI